MEDIFSNIEQLIIVKLLEEPEKVYLVKEKYFKIPIAKHILKGIQQKVENKATYFDAITFSQDFANKEFDQIKLFLYLSDVRPLLESFEYHANVLKERYFKVKIKNKLIESAKGIDEPNSDFYHLFADFEGLKQEVDSAIDVESETLQTNLNEAVNEMYQRIQNRKNGVVKLETGKRKLDELLTIQNGDVILIAARPSMGKTSFAVDLAYNFAEKGSKVLVISVEVSKLNLTNKILLSENENIDSNKFKKGLLSEKECTSIEESLNKFDKLEIFIEDKTSYIDDIVRLIAIEKRKRDIDVVFIDYIQLIKVEKVTTDVQAISEISKKIKSAAKENDVPIFALSQLNRAVESRGSDMKHQLSDLRGSGSLEEDADVIMFLFREYRAHQMSGLPDLPDWNEQSSRTMEIQIRKNRNGECDDVELFHNKTVTKFYDEFDSQIQEIEDEFNNIVEEESAY